MSEQTTPAKQPLTVTIGQATLNAARALLNQTGWAKDLEDFYYAGKTLAEWPKSKMLSQNSTQEQMEALLAERVEVIFTDEAVRCVKKAFKHYIEQKQAPTEHHFELLQSLSITPKSSI